MRVKIREFSRTPDEDVERIVRRIRDTDRTELWELSRRTPEEAVRQSLEGSAESYVAYIDGKPSAALGHAAPALDDRAIVWLLGTDEVTTAGLSLVRMTRRYAAHLLRTHSLI